jgi:DNA transposition AAA+ family ATPase
VAEFNRAELPKNGSGRRAYYVYSRDEIRPRDMMKRIAVACGSPVSNSTDDMIRGLAWTFRTRRVLLVIDEAQHLSIKCLETIRELNDQPPCFSLLFAGSHTLKQTLDRFAATLGQLNSRIIIKLSLPGLVRTEADGIIRRELHAVIAKMSEAEIKVLVDELIRQSTEKDIFQEGRKYINVRTLTSVLNRMKMQLAAPESK